MNTDLNFRVDCVDLQATCRLAANLAKACRGGEVFELSGDLGAGKTTFVAAFMVALGYRQPVTSPTFSLQNTYELDDSKKVYHFDLYRLDSLGGVDYELQEALADNKGITIVEWARELPAGRHIKIDIQPTKDIQSRQINISISQKVDYIKEALV